MDPSGNRGGSSSGPRAHRRTEALAQADSDRNRLPASQLDQLRPKNPGRFRREVGSDCVPRFGLLQKFGPARQGIFDAAARQSFTANSWEVRGAVEPASAIGIRLHTRKQGANPPAPATPSSARMTGVTWSHALENSACAPHGGLASCGNDEYKGQSVRTRVDDTTNNSASKVGYDFRPMLGLGAELSHIEGADSNRTAIQLQKAQPAAL